MLKKMNSDLGKDHIKVYEENIQDIHFVNVDLEIWSKEDLQVIIDEFGKDVLVMANHTFENGDRLASFEICMESVSLDANADEIISSFCSLIRNFSKEVQDAWNSSYKKVFDIGFESGNTENSFNTELTEKTLKEVAEIGATIVITIYPVLNYTIQSKDNSEII